MNANQLFRLLLLYTDFLPYATLGELFIWKIKDDSFPEKYYTLQPPVISEEDWGKLIPCNTYPLKYSMMLKHKVMHYELLNVPNSEGIYIHGGNSAADTDGCILVGEKLVQKDLRGQYNLESSTYAWLSIEMYLNKLDSEIIISKRI
ncbi:MAG: DUF5675 family protein [Nitrososphaeria archaeon]|jgi:hypothetical protein